MSWVDRGTSPGLSKLELAGVLAQFIGIHFTR